VQRRQQLLEQLRRRRLVRRRVERLVGDELGRHGRRGRVVERRELVERRRNFVERRVQWYGLERSILGRQLVERR
jgi:hypothetical protein